MAAEQQDTPPGLEALAWITEAIQTSFENNDVGGEDGSRVVKVAWGQPAAVPVEPAGPPVASHARQEFKRWAEQYRLLIKREGLAAAEVVSGAGPWIRELGPEEDNGGPTLVQLKRKAWAEIKGIKEAVAAVKHQLQNAKPGPTYVADLAAHIDRVDDALATFKRWQAGSMADLAEQQARLEEEVEAAAFRIEDDMLGSTPGVYVPGAGAAAAGAGSGPSSRRTTAEEPGRRASSAPRSRRASIGPGSTGASSNKLGAGAGGGSSILGSRGGGGHGGGGSLAPEVAEFEEFVLRTGGDTGGWDPDDHAEFLNILKACGGDYVHAVNVTLERCVGYTRTEVMQHARWHMDYMDLLVRKRMAVAAWRARRDQQRSKALAAAALYEGPDTAQVARAEVAAAASVSMEVAREQAVKKELVQGWKERKEAAMRAAAEAAAERARQAEERKRIELEERQHFNKLKLEFHRQAKERMEAEARQRAAAAQAERAALTALTPQQAAAIAVRNAEAERRRQQLRESKEAAAMQRAVVQSKLLEKVRVEAPRDPNRLLKGTSAHMRRVEVVREEERKPKDSSFILHHMPQRAVPSWRAGLGY